MIENKLSDVLSELGITKDNTLIVCAVSGGADSVCLLNTLHSLGYRVAAAHYNHCLRGEESDRDELFVSELCASIDVPFISERGDVKKYSEETGMGLEESARIMRYDFLERARLKLGGTYIATAHNANDNAETFLLNLLRGTGLKGLCGIPVRRDSIIRPLIKVSRDEIESYLADKNLTYVTDSTNLEDFCKRNTLRHKVIPELRALAPDFIEKTIRTIEVLSCDESFISEQADLFIASHVADGKCSVNEIASLSKAVFAAVVSKLCPRSLSKEHIDSVYRLCSSDSAYADCDMPGIRISKRKDALYFGVCDNETVEEYCYVIKDNEETVIKEAGISVSSELIPNCEEIYSLLNTFDIKCGSIEKTLSVKNRRGGEKILLSGRGCEKSLKKLFRESDIPTEKRGSVPLFYLDNELCAVYGFGVSEAARPAPGDCVYRLKIKKIKPSEDI